jgi:hypothetical protein
MLQGVSHCLKRFLSLGLPPRPRRAVPLRRSLKPTLEILEDRLVPAAPPNNLLYVAKTANAPWTVAGESWVNTGTGEYAAPAAGDNLTFDPSMTTMVMVKGVPTPIQGSDEPATDPNNTAIGNLFVASTYDSTITFSTTGVTQVTGTMNLANGTLAGGSSAFLRLTGSTTSNWTGGTVNLSLGVGAFGLQEQAPTNLTINGGTNPVQMSGRIFDYGTVTLLGAGIAENGADFLPNGYQILTNQYGVFNIMADASLTQQTGGAAPAMIDNQGVFEKKGGGTSTIANPFFNDGSQTVGTLLAGSGTLALTNATTYQQGSTAKTILNGGNLNVFNYLILGGLLTGVGTINGNVNNGDPTEQKPGAGTVQPGVSGGPGTLNIVGNYFQSEAGWLRINVAMSGVEFLNVQGNADIEGGLYVYRDPNYTPPLGTQIQFLNVTGTLQTDFDTEEFVNNSWSAGDFPYLYFSTLLKGNTDSLVVDAGG